MDKKISNLEDIGNRIPFTVPKDYFTRFNQEIIKHLPEQPKPVAKKITLWDKTKPWVYMAAMFVGLFFSIRVLTTNMDKENTRTQARHQVESENNTTNYWANVSISEEEFYQYLEEQINSQESYQYLFEEIYQQSL